MSYVIKVKYVSADANATLPVGTLIWGVVGDTTTLTSTARVVIGDVATSAAITTANTLIAVNANLASETPSNDTATYEDTFGVFLPKPVKAYTAVSVDVTNCVCYIYYS